MVEEVGESEADIIKAFLKRQQTQNKGENNSQAATNMMNQSKRTAQNSALSSSDSEEENKTQSIPLRPTS